NKAMKAAVYARVSSDSQDVDLSISAQLRAVRDYANRNGYEIVREYVDEAESGRSASRPRFMEMIAVAKLKNLPFSAILVWKLNRFSRSRVDSVTYKTLLKNKGIRVISINEHLDESPSGQLLEGIIESVDEFYSANLGQDIKRGLRENAARGFYSIGRAPYGLRKVPIKDGVKTRYKLEPEPEDSISIKVVRRIFEMALKRIGCKQIASTLNREGFLTSTGQRWGKTTVHKILNNEAYCGTLVFGGRPGHPALHSGEPPVRVENAWPSLIDKDTFRQVQKVMSHNAPKAVHPRIVPSFYLLSGMLVCACGSAMVGRSAKSHRYYYYTCNRSCKQGREACDSRILPKDKIERLVIDQIKQRVLNRQCLEELVRMVNEELDTGHLLTKDKLTNIDTELLELENRLSRLYDALETGKLTLDDLAPRIKELRAKQDELSKARVIAEAEMMLQGYQPININIMASYVTDLRNILDESDVAQGKAFLRSFVKKIVVEKERVKLYYNLPVPPDGRKMDTVGVLPIDTPSGPKGPFVKPKVETFFEVTL
ncbi:MAG: recombinase family protein, partial [Bacteroidales bacterium]|nr:recombinase family protein [Bacteroidales bacterium]